MGHDRYYFTYDEGKDTIQDIDGKGEIQFNAAAVEGELTPLPKHEGEYTLDRGDASFKFTRTANGVASAEGADLTMTIDEAFEANTKNSITIENFTNNTLGLTIGAAEEVTEAECSPSSTATTCIVNLSDQGEAVSKTFPHEAAGEPKVTLVNGGAGADYVYASNLNVNLDGKAGDCISSPIRFQIKRAFALAFYY